MMRRRLAWPTVAAAGLLVLSVTLSGCSATDSKPQHSTGSGVAGGSTASEAGTESGEPAVVGTRTLDVEGAPKGLKIELLKPVDEGKTMTLDFTFSLASSASKDYELTRFNVGGAQGDRGFDVWVIADNQRYLPGRNSAGDCACSTDLRGKKLGPGEDVTLSATFAKPTGDFTVHVEGVPDFAKVSVK